MNRRKQAKKQLRIALPPGIKWGAWKECCELLKAQREQQIEYNEHVLEWGQEAGWKRRNLEITCQALNRMPLEVLQQAQALLQQVEML
jgi:hypothetical protein